MATRIPNFDQRLAQGNPVRRAGPIQRAMEENPYQIPLEDQMRQEEMRELLMHGNAARRVRVDDATAAIQQTPLTYADLRATQEQMAMQQNVGHAPPKELMDHIREMLSDNKEVFSFIANIAMEVDVHPEQVIKTLLKEAYDRENRTGNPIIDDINEELKQIKEEANGVSIQADEDKSRAQTYGRGEGTDYPF